MKFEDFQDNCLKGLCLRRSFISKKCKNLLKQQKCYKKWSLSQTKSIEIDEEWIQTRDRIRERDKVCQMWEILSTSEKEYILSNFYSDFKMFVTTLDVCHIIPKAHNKKLYYVDDNLVLCSRYFHQLLDTYRHPVTRELITGEDRLNWFKKARYGI